MSLSATSLRSSLMPRTTALSNAVLVVGGVLGLAALAQIAIPVPGSPVPVTGQTLGVLVLGTAYGSTLGFTTFALYMLAGIAGAPVFANSGHGLDRLVGATGGYLVGMLVATFVLGQFARFRLDQKFLTALPSMLVGTVITFSFGLVWLHQYTGQSWSWTISAGLTPFIVGEALKIAIAGTSLPAVWRFVNRKNS
ncbi:MAG: biotin transporter BioY [Acidobacteriota bacterium]|jgi:biotin transport system substrate-specific component|nr:biotin transporter BioY [Acidobacteriota bacterium]